MGKRAEAGGGRRSGVGAIAVGLAALLASPAAAFDAQLGWSPVSGSAGYKVYVRQSGQAYGSGVDVGLLQPGTDGVVRYVDYGVPNDIADYFAVTDYDSSGAESALSNEISLLVMDTPTATFTPTVAATQSPTSSGAATASRAPTATATRPPTTSTPAATKTPTRAPTATATAKHAPTGTSPPTPSRTPTRTSTPAGTAAASGPVAAYAFGEGSGTSTADASGNGHTGTLFGNPVWTAGRYGSALQFSGGATYDGVNLAPNNGFDGLVQGTLEAWVKFDTSAAAGIHDWFDGHDTAGCSYPFEFDFNNRGGTVYWEVWAGNTAQCTATFYAQVPIANPGLWHHLAYVVSGIGNTWYLDGIAQTPSYLAGSASTRFFFASIAASSNTRYDVGTSEMQSETFKGIIDELRIYARPLTQAEIQSDMNAPVGSVPTSTPTRTATPGTTRTATRTPTATATPRRGHHK
jgi:hypothetical protein